MRFFAQVENILSDLSKNKQQLNNVNCMLNNVVDGRCWSMFETHLVEKTLHKYCHVD